jgi:hypothetical protein
MSKLTIAGFLSCVIACAACTSDSTSGNATGGGSTSDPFLGRWACSEEMSLTFTSPPGASPLSETEMTTITISGASGALTATKVVDSGTGCKVSFTSSGTSASLTEGQTCTTDDGVSIVYKSGSATVDGNKLTSTFDFEASGMFNIMGMRVAATANGTQASTCQRVSPPATTGGATTGGTGW